MIGLGIIVAMMMAPVPAPSACPAERAIYTLRGERGVTAGFARQRYQVNYASKLFFWVKTPGRRWWFSFNAPNGYGGVYLTPDVDPATIPKPDYDVEPPATSDPDPAQINFDSFDAKYGALNGPPQLGDPAPAHLFIRDLGPLFWYNPVAAANGDKKAKSASIPIAMWDRTGCAPK